MSLCYNKLWKMLIDKNINKNQSHKMTELSAYTITELVDDENINTEVLEKICKVLNCQIGDIVGIEGGN